MVEAKVEAAESNPRKVPDVSTRLLACAMDVFAVASDDVLSIGIDGVVAAPAADDVSTVAAEDAVVPGPGVDMVVAAAAKDDVAAGSTEERLVRGCPLDSPGRELSADLFRADPDDEGDGVVR